MLGRRLHQTAEQVAADGQNLGRIVPLLADPVRVIVTTRPIVARRVTVLEVLVSVIDAGLAPICRAGEVQLTGQATGVTRVGQPSRQETLLRGKVRVAIRIDVHRARVLAGEEARATWRANRALAVGVGERHPFGDESIEIRSVDVRISECTNRVEALLIGAIPENVWSTVRHGNSFLQISAPGTQYARATGRDRASRTIAGDP